MKITVNKEIDLKQVFIDSLFGFSIFMLGVIFFVKFIMPEHTEPGLNILPWEGWLFLICSYITYTVSLLALELYRVKK